MNDNEQLANKLINENNELKSKIEELSNKLFVINKGVLNIFSNLSHELRTPLNGIIGFSELMSTTRLSSEEVMQYSSVIEESANVLMATFNDAFDITKLETGNYTIVKEVFDLNDLIFEIFMQFKIEAENKNLQLFLENLISEPFYIFSAKIELKKILTRLVENAIKYTKQGWVKIKYEVDSYKVVFFIEDTGIGVSPDVLPKLFNSFFTEMVSKSRHVSGTGIDLTLCSGLVRLLGGEIKYLPKQGQGSIFSFTFNHLEKP